MGVLQALTMTALLMATLLWNVFGVYQNAGGRRPCVAVT